MIVAGLDIGGTNTEGVILKDGKILSKTLLLGGNEFIAGECFDSIVEKAGIKKDDIDAIAVTGGGGRKIRDNYFGKEFKRVDEIESIGRGAMHLSGEKNLFVANIGTGTSFVLAKGGKITHLGGSGVGGGTIKGLGSILLDSTADEVEMLASSGNRQNVDMTVFDIIGSDLLNIPADATAANFGKVLVDYKRDDVASAILNMISESIGVMSYFAAKSEKLENNILICGRVSVNELIKSRILETIGLFGGKAKIPENAEYCTAIGAALSVA